MADNETYINEETLLDHEIWIPIQRQSQESLEVYVRFHMRNIRRFMDWLESEGFAICKGAMPQQNEKIKDLYHKYQYTRRGLCVPSAL